MPWRTVMMGGLCLLGLAVGSDAQTPRRALFPDTTQYLTVQPVPLPAPVARGRRVTLTLEVTPNPGMHIYAAGARDVVPVTLAAHPPAGITVGRPRYSAPDVAQAPGAVAAAPAYRRPFRVTVPVTIGAGVPPGTVAVPAEVQYQACDDRLCYPSVTATTLWMLSVSR